jgi:hypothetical protein
VFGMIHKSNVVTNFVLISVAYTHFGTEPTFHGANSVSVVLALQYNSYVHQTLVHFSKRV